MLNTLFINKTDSQIYTCRGLYNKKMLNQCMKLIKKTECVLESSFSSGKDFFAKKRRLLSMKIGNFHSKNDFDLNFDIRTLKLLSYYELDYTEQVYSLINSYKHYIKNSKDANNARRKSKKLFLNALLILMKIKTGNDLSRIPQLNSEVKKLNVWLQKWFNDKIKGLIKINK